MQLLLSQFVESSIDFSLFFFSELFVFLFLQEHVVEQIFGVDEGVALIQVFNIVQGLHQLHLSFRVVGFGFEKLHGVALLLFLPHFLHKLLSLLSILNGLIVSGAAVLHNIIMVFGVRFEADLIIAVSALEIESKHFNAQVGFLVADFHSHVELGADVQVVGADIAPQGHGQHVSHIHQLILAPASLDQQFGVEVLREILYQHFSFSHFTKSVF